MYWIQAITPLHVGAGKGVGFIDLPIMREKVTNWPLVPGSAVKGVIRDHFTQNASDEQKKLIEIAFGKLVSDDTSNAGSLVLTDAHVVCLPVRSLYGTFAYTTSHLVLERLKRDLEAAGYNNLPPAPSPENTEVFHTTDKIVYDKRIFFEDLDFIAKSDDNTNKWADTLAGILFSTDTKWKSIFKERFAILSDDSFNFLAETGTEIAARIRIKPEKKIVDKGALWYEESLPAETILAGIAWCDRVFGGNGINQEKIIETFCNNSGLNVQIGGKATVGKGRVKCLFTKG
jgi:CRISPR-associated protein Cmr4